MPQRSDEARRLLRVTQRATRAAGATAADQRGNVGLLAGLIHQLVEPRATQADQLGYLVNCEQPRLSHGDQRVRETRVPCVGLTQHVGEMVAGKRGLLQQRCNGTIHSRIVADPDALDSAV
jgi:hypothetical protein